MSQCCRRVLEVCCALFQSHSSLNEIRESVVEEDGHALEGRVRDICGEEGIARYELFSVGQLADACLLKGDDVWSLLPLPLGQQASFGLQTALHILLQNAQCASFRDHGQSASPTSFPYRGAVIVFVFVYSCSSFFRLMGPAVSWVRVSENPRSVASCLGCHRLCRVGRWQD